MSDGFTPVYAVTERSPGLSYPIISAKATRDMMKSGYRFPAEAEWENE
jgi:hypothetical protein